MRKPYSGIARGGVIVLLVSVPLVVWGAGNPVDIIKYRQNVMKSIGGNTSAAAALLQGKVAFKERLTDHARALEAATKNIAQLFPTGSESGAKTRALDAIWKNRAEFEKQAQNAEAKAAAFAKAVAAKDDGQAKATFKELADSCKACHKDFRKDEK